MQLRKIFPGMHLVLCKNEQKTAAESAHSTSTAVCVMFLDPDQIKDPGVVAQGDGSPVARVHETTKTMHTQRSKWSLLLDINEKPGPSRCVSTSSEDPDHAARSWRHYCTVYCSTNAIGPIGSHRLPSVLRSSSLLPTLDNSFRFATRLAARLLISLLLLVRQYNTTLVPSGAHRCRVIK